MSKYTCELVLETRSEYRKNPTEKKVGQHLQKLIKRLKFMESHKRTKPHYSQCCDRLYEQVTYLLGGESDEPGVIERRINETEDQSF